jgi:hypothetical protein
VLVRDDWDDDWDLPDGTQPADDVWLGEYRAAFVQARFMRASDCEARWFGEAYLAMRGGYPTRDAVWWFIGRVLTRCPAWIALTVLEVALLFAAALVVIASGPAAIAVLGLTAIGLLAILVIALAIAWYF